VSIARQLGVEFISTHLDRLRPKTDFSVSVPGQYAKLEDHVEVHRYFIEAAEQRELEFEEAVRRWHDEAYQPIAAAIHDQGLLSDFPGRTTTDFYLWIAEHRLLLQDELGWAVSSEAATASLAETFSTRKRPLLDRAGRAILNTMIPASFKSGPAAGQWRKTKMVARYSDRLFADILVPLSATPPSWAVVDQALGIAQREGGRVHGVHISTAEAELGSPAVEALRQEFERRCAAAQIQGSFNLEVGEVADRVRAIAALTDLVVIGLDPAVPALSAEVMAWMRYCTRPILTVPLIDSNFQHALLAYDGSPKSKEALFVAAYLGERWQTRLTLITVNDPGRADGTVRVHSNASRVS